MSSRKTISTEATQPRTTPSRRELATPSANQSGQRTSTRLRSVRSIRHVGASNGHPGSARGILRRLARVTAPTTKRRIVTPTSIPRDKENIAPEDEDELDDLKTFKPKFNIEESIEEDDSELQIAPTPSALLDYSDDEEPPTLTFQLFEDARSAKERPSHISLLPQSDSALQDEGEYADDGNSTFLTERGRRAVSEEPTRMSRYSFGSIRMSDFGTELEVARESDRQEKLVIEEMNEDYGTEYGNDVLVDGETEDLRGLQPSSSRTLISVGEPPEDADAGTNNDFQFALEDYTIDDHAAALVRSRAADQSQLANPVIATNNTDEDENVLEQDETVSATSNRRHALLESVSAVATAHPRKKIKMNSRGNMVPSLPSSLIKRIVHKSQEKANKRKTTLGKDHMKALEQATEWFFEQVSQDLETYSSHGRRKKRIDADDVLLLMRRQRLLRTDGGLQKLAKEWLPPETLNELDLPDRP